MKPCRRWCRSLGLVLWLGWLPFALAAARKGDRALPVWPPAPETPRIAFVQFLTGPADLGWTRSFGARVIGFIIGDNRREARFKPAGVALDGAGNILVSDTDAGEVCGFEARRKKFHRWGRIGPYRLQSPVGVAMGADECYVTDSGLGALIAFGLDGKVRWAVTNGLERPSGVVVEGGKIFVAEAGAHRISVFDGRGKKMSEFGKRGSGPCEFNFPTHIAGLPDGRLLVTDAMNARVQILDPDGKPLSVVGSRGDGSGHFDRPKGVAADKSGHIYVVDALFDNVQVFDAEGRFLLNFGEPGRGVGEFWMPAGIAVGPDNRILVADAYNRRVQVFRYLGEP